MRKKKSSFDNVADNFDLDGHDTIIQETDIRNMDKNFKKNKNLGF